MALSLRQLALSTNWPVIVAVTVLCGMGVLSIWTDSPAEGRKQLIFMGLGLGIIVAMQAISYMRIGKWAWPLYVLALLLLVYTVAPFMQVPRYDQRLFRVPETNGAYAWINFGVLRFQPAELTKIAFVMVMARYLRFRNNYRTFFGLLAPFTLAVVPLMLILKQPDLGTAIVFIPTLFVMLFVAGAKIRHLLAIVGMGVVLSPVLWFSGEHMISGAGRAPQACTVCPRVPLLNKLPQFVKHYQRDRVHAMFSTDARTLADTGFQQHNALIAFGSGGVSGKGAGNIPVGRRVPESHNDMIFALVGEQFGFFGAGVVMIAYIVLFAAGIEIAGSTREPFGRMVAVGIVALLAGQAFLNLMVAMKLMPVTGVTLPFVSYGGSSLLASCIAVGLLLNIGQNRPMVIGRDSFEFE